MVEREIAVKDNGEIIGLRKVIDSLKKDENFIIGHD